MGECHIYSVRGYSALSCHPELVSLYVPLVQDDTLKGNLRAMQQSLLRPGMTNIKTIKLWRARACVVFYQ